MTKKELREKTDKMLESLRPLVSGWIQSGKDFVIEGREQTEFERKVK